MDVVGSVKGLLLKKDAATTDNVTFKLHYRATFSILIGSMLLVSRERKRQSDRERKTDRCKLHYRATFSDRQREKDRQIQTVPSLQSNLLHTHREYAVDIDIDIDLFLALK